MLNIGSGTKKVKATIGKNLEAEEILRRPTSLDNLQLDTEETATQEGLHSAPETSTKPKTRSRLSAAIRKLSKSRRKKKDKSLSKTTSPEPSETIVSSGAEEQPSETIAAGGQENSKQKKPSKLSKRFLLGGLKRSKISPKKETVEKDDIPTVRTLSQTTSTDELITQSGKQSLSAIPKHTRPSLVSDLVASGGLQRLDRISKVQITLRGKKVAPAQSSDDVRRRVLSAKTTAEKAASDSVEELQKEPTERDYLTPTEEDLSAGCHTSSVVDQVHDPSASPASSSSTLGTETDLAKAKKKRIKSKKIYNTTTTCTTSCKATQASSIPTVTPISPFSSSTSITSPPTTAPPTEEKFVITQSRRDTPPLEQAPAKPSRVAVVPVSQSTTSTGEIRKPIIRAAPSLTARRYDSRRTTISVQQSNTLHSATETESDLMQNPQGGIERGHRFPKPTTPIAIEANPSGNKTLESTDATTPAVTNPQQRQRQIKFQLQSVASQNLSQPSPPPSPIEDFAEQPTTSSFLQKPSNLPPPPPPVTSCAATSTSETSESRSPDRTNSLLPSEQLYLATRVLPTEVKSVASAHRNDPDEAISSAESAQQQDSDLYPSYNRRNRYSAGYALSQDSQSTLRADDSNDSDKSSASQSPVSESNRRRIRYVAQPTLYDENDRIESRREALSYLFSAAVIDSADSDFDQYDDYQMPAFGDLTMEQMEPPIMTSTGEKREHLYKILVIGELGTGKTSFIKRYVHQFFSQNYRATIGVDFALKVLHWDTNTVVRLQLWDIAGQERFGNMTRVYYKEAVGAFIVFDVTRSGTFDCVSKWKDDLDSKVQLPDGSPIPCILLANKCDQDKQGIVATPEKIDEYVRENGFAGWFETSAKENINIDEAARALVNKILLNDKLISDADLADSEKFNLNSADPTSTESKGKCSC